MNQVSREIDIEEHPEITWLSVVFGYGPMLPFLAGATVAWQTEGLLQDEAVALTLTWAITVLAFLSGVRRGLSFRTEGGPQLAQILTMLALFLLALLSFLAEFHGFMFPASILVLMGFVMTMVLDPIAARRGQAPLFFARLRPPQMMLATASLAALAVNIWLKG